MKNKRKIFYILLIIVILVYIFQHLYIIVEGSIISDSISQNNITTIKIVKIVKTQTSTVRYDIAKEVVLNDEQIELLISLLKDTKFKKILYNKIYFRDDVKYIVTGKNSDGQQLFNLRSYCGKFAIVDSIVGNEFISWRLRIKNDEWQTKLDEIIFQ